MDPSRELVEPAQVGTALAVLSGVSLAAAGVLLVRKRRREGFLAACGALAFPLWLIYNGIENHFGLDSVAALLINLALFAALGIGIGLLSRRFDTHHGDTETRSGDTGKEQAGQD